MLCCNFERNPYILKPELVAAHSNWKKGYICIAEEFNLLLCTEQPLCPGTNSFRGWSQLLPGPSSALGLTEMVGFAQSSACTKTQDFKAGDTNPAPQSVILSHRGVFWCLPLSNVPLVINPVTTQVCGVLGTGGLGF